MTGIDAIAGLFAGPGARDYLGEAVTIGEHMRQAGALAEAAGAAAPLVAAALLHDVGHLRGETDARHGAGGARWLRQWFGPAVTEPVRLHVAAKRYLCAAEPGYFDLLSPESVRTLALQGGPMTPDQVTAFEALPHGRDAVAREMDASADAARGIAAASSVILGKEEMTDFDVFLCHHAADKPAIRRIAQRLRERGLLPWLDEAELIPGRSWQEELERQISNIRAAAVFVGPSGFGPWQNRELRAFLNEFAERGCPVIPALLPEATAPALPVFLKGLTWVDLRAADGFERLIWGITGRKPGFSGLDEPLE